MQQLQRPIPQFGCNGYATAVAVGQRQLLYSGSGVKMLSGYHLSFF